MPLRFFIHHGGEKRKDTLKYAVKWSHSVVSDSATLWTVACQTPLTIGFSRQECWSGLPFPSPGDLSDPGIKPESPSLQADSLPSESPGKFVLKIHHQALPSSKTLEKRLKTNESKQEPLIAEDEVERKLWWAMNLAVCIVNSKWKMIQRCECGSKMINKARNRNYVLQGKIWN